MRFVLPEEMASRSEHRAANGWTWLTRGPGVGLAFAWGLAEATFFLVIPDVAISLAAIFAPKQAWRHVIAAVAGALVGGAMMYTWAVSAPGKSQAVVAHVPFVRAKMFAKVHSSYIKHGAGAVFIGPFAGIPYKIYAVEAPEFLSCGRFLAATVPARGERFVLIWLAFAAGSTALRRWFGRSDRQLVAYHAAIWILVYAIYWGAILLHG